ncbi:pyruvate kinase, partial [Candidatus Gracilibacteria bacterium]
MKQTKIITTIGPASEDKEILKKLYDAGANIARINCSHFEEEEFLRKVNNIKELNKTGETNFSILLDTKGPEIRTTMMDTPLEIKASDKVIVTIPEFAD